MSLVAPPSPTLDTMTRQTTTNHRSTDLFLLLIAACISLDTTLFSTGGRPIFHEQFFQKTALPKTALPSNTLPLASLLTSLHLTALLISQAFSRQMKTPFHQLAIRTKAPFLPIIRTDDYVPLMKWSTGTRPEAQIGLGPTSARPTLFLRVRN